MESIAWKKVIITCVSLDAEVLARATTYKVPFQHLAKPNPHQPLKVKLYDIWRGGSKAVTTHRQAQRQTSRDMSRLHEYQVIGRKLPTENDATPKLYRMRIFAPNTQVAKSRFWYFLKQARKVKKASGEIVTVNEV